ncbi:hypothetical protein HK096_000763, partial [Nowakowskiella sp. JEL0078]
MDNAQVSDDSVVSALLQLSHGQLQPTNEIPVNSQMQLPQHHPQHFQHFHPGYQVYPYSPNSHFSLVDYNAHDVNENIDSKRRRISEIQLPPNSNVFSSSPHTNVFNSSPNPNVFSSSPNATDKIPTNRIPIYIENQNLQQNISTLPVSPDFDNIDDSKNASKRGKSSGRPRGRGRGSIRSRKSSTSVKTTETERDIGLTLAGVLNGDIDLDLISSPPEKKKLKPTDPKEPALNLSPRSAAKLSGIPLFTPLSVSKNKKDVSKSDVEQKFKDKEKISDMDQSNLPQPDMKGNLRISPD